MTFDPSGLVDYLRLITPESGTSLLLHEAIVEAPEITLTIDGASTLTVVVNDNRRKLASSDVFAGRSYAEVSGVNFEVAGRSKAGDDVTLTFEDAIAAAMRRSTKRHTWQAGKLSRREILLQLARDAEVKATVDPTKRGTVKSAVKRGPADNGWDVSGTLAEDVQWRRFSNTKRMIAGGDEWLLGRQDKAHQIQEDDGVWGSLDFDLDTGKRADTLTTTVVSDHKILAPGDLADVVDDYPALAGRWMVQEYRYRLLDPFADVTLTRPRKALKEPKREAGASDGESGDPNFLPDVEGDPGASSASSPTTPGRERMIAFAMSHQGDSYVWGGNGPTGWDCSGLVQAATAAGGRTLAKPSASQWATCQANGRTVSVEEGLRTRGALLFRIGSGDYNHVAISLGNGSTIEAMGTAYGVLVAGNAAGRGWTGAAVWL